MRKNINLLLVLQEAAQVGGVQVVLQVAVGQHEQVQVPAGRHHLVEGAELLEAQRPLVVVGVGLLHRPEQPISEWFFNFKDIFS